MMFLNAILLAGAAAFAIPLIIHLLNRSKFKTMDWGAMIFLDDALKVNTRRIQWQTWLLLLLRCAIPIVLAVCMARPLLQSFFGADFLVDNGSSTATAVVLDNSYSMQAYTGTDAGKNTARMDKAVEQASKLMDGAASGGLWSIVSNADAASADLLTPSRDKKQVTQRLANVHSGAGKFDLVKQIETAIGELGKTSTSQQRIVVLSDFQATMCDAIDAASIATLRTRMEELATPPSLVFMPLAKASNGSEQNNLSVRIDPQTRSLVGVESPWEMRVVVKNHSKAAQNNVVLTVTIDNVSIASRKFDVPGETETQTVFRFEFPESASHKVEAKIDVDEAVTGDNRATWAVISIGSIPVLVVDPTLNDPNKLAESEFLQTALNPFAFSQPNSNDLFKVTAISPDQCSPAIIAKNKVVILANVPRLSDEAVAAIKQQTELGGILMMFAGDRIDPNWYNDKFANGTLIHAKNVTDAKKEGAATSAASQIAFLPFAFDAQPKKTEEAQEGFRIRREAFTHPGVAFLNDSRWGGVDSLEIRSYYRLLQSPNQKSTNKPPFDGAGKWVFNRANLDEGRFEIPRKRIKLISANFGLLDGEAGDAKAIEEMNSSVTTLLSLASGDPFLAERAFGEGVVLQCATSCSDNWSNWPQRTFFLPMLHQCLLSAAAPKQWQANVSTGQTLSTPSDNVLRWLYGQPLKDEPVAGQPVANKSNNDASAKIYTWELPMASGNIQPKVEQLSHPSSENKDPVSSPVIVATYPGIYSIERAGGSQNENGKVNAEPGVNQAPLYLSAQSPTEESKLATLSDQGLASLAERMGAKIVVDAEQYLQLSQGNGREVWQWFLIALLILLFGEILLQRSMSGASR